MVISSESVELDPSPEDLLTVLGKEITAQSLGEFFGKSEGYGSAAVAGAGSRASYFAKGLLEESWEPSGSLRVIGSDPVKELQISESNVWGRKGIDALPGKSLSPSKTFCPSGGLEDIINSVQNIGVWRPVGGLIAARNEAGGDPQQSAVNRGLFPKKPSLSVAGPEGLDPGSFVKQGPGANDELGNDSPVAGKVGSPIEGIGESSSRKGSDHAAGAEDGARGGVGEHHPEIGKKSAEPELRRSGEKRKKSKPLKTKCFAELVLGMDVQVEGVLEVAEVTLVGRIRGKPVSGKAIRQWAESQWTGTPAASFKSNALVKGWFMASFDSREALEWVEGRNWTFGSRPVFFKRWTPLFDAETEKVEEFPIWV